MKTLPKKKKEEEEESLGGSLLYWRSLEQKQIGEKEKEKEVTPQAKGVVGHQIITTEG